MAQTPSGPAERAFQVRLLAPAASKDGSTVGGERPEGEGERAADAVRLLRVLLDEEALVVSQAATKASGDAGAPLAPELRVPLLLATASLLPGGRRVVHVALPSPHELECLDGMQVAPGQAHSKFRGPPQLPSSCLRFSFKCRSGSEARRLLDSLSLAGCTMQGCSERYNLRKEVGHGGFGRVFMAEDSWTGDVVAVKVFQHKASSAADHPLREAAMRRWCSDISLFPKFKSVQLLPQSQKEHSTESGGTSRFAIVTEFVDGVELFDVLRQGPLPEACVKPLMRQILSGISELHRRGIMHRDIKPENVMVTHDEVKLVDFGLACPEWDLEATSRSVGSAGYVAPEVITRASQARSTKADCFSAGALLCACLSGSGPFSGGSHVEVLRRNAACRVKVDSFNAMPQGARNLLKRLLRSNPGERLTACECLNHPWIVECPVVSPADGNDVSRYTRRTSGGLPATKLATISESQSESEEELWSQISHVPTPPAARQQQLLASRVVQTPSLASTRASPVARLRRLLPWKARRRPPAQRPSNQVPAVPTVSAPSGLRRSRNRDGSTADGSEEGAAQAMELASAHACQAGQAVDQAPRDARRTSKAPARSGGRAPRGAGRRSASASPGGEGHEGASGEGTPESTSSAGGASGEGTPKSTSSVIEASGGGTPKSTSSVIEASGGGTPKSTSSVVEASGDGILKLISFDERLGLPRLARRLASLGAATLLATSNRRGVSESGQEKREGEFHQVAPQR